VLHQAPLLQHQQGIEECTLIWSYKRMDAICQLKLYTIVDAVEKEKYSHC
jgi:hypothetical protein